MLKNKRAMTIAVTTLIFLAACGAPGKYKDGIYQGKGDGMGGPVMVSVSVEKGRISKITVTEHHETPGLSDASIKEIPEAILDAQSLDVDTISGATVTSNAIIDAVAQSLEKSK